MSSIIEPHSISSSPASPPTTQLTTSYYNTLLSTIIALSVISFVFVLTSGILAICIWYNWKVNREADVEDARAVEEVRSGIPRSPTTGKDGNGLGGPLGGIPLATASGRDEAAAKTQPQTTPWATPWTAQPGPQAPTYQHGPTHTSQPVFKEQPISQAPLRTRQPPTYPPTRRNTQPQSRPNPHPSPSQPRDIQQPPRFPNPPNSRRAQRQGDDRIQSLSSVSSAGAASGEFSAFDDDKVSGTAEVEGRLEEQASVEETGQIENPAERAGEEQEERLSEHLLTNSFTHSKSSTHQQDLHTAAPPPPPTSLPHPSRPTTSPPAAPPLNPSNRLSSRTPSRTLSTPTSTRRSQRPPSRQPSKPSQTPSHTTSLPSQAPASPPLGIHKYPSIASNPSQHTYRPFSFRSPSQSSTPSSNRASVLSSSSHRRPSLGGSRASADA